jgi:phosphohistidine phosphatase SixA
MAGEKLTDPDGDFVRGLDNAGRVTAAALAETLPEHVVPAELVSSSYFRCTETVVPLAERLELPIRCRDELGPAAPREAAMDLLLAVDDHTIVCTHREVITRVFDGLDCEKGAFWVVQRGQGKLWPATYVAPPAPLRPGDELVLTGATG